MINKYALLAAFVFTGALSVLGWDNVMSELPNYIALTSLNDCTFACSSRLAQGFWTVVAFTVLFTSVAVASLVGFAVSFKPVKS